MMSRLTPLIDSERFVSEIERKVNKIDKGTEYLSWSKH